MALAIVQKKLDDNFTDQRTFAGRLSDAAKYVWLGSFGLFYTGLMAKDPPLSTFYHENNALLLLAAGLGVLAFLADVFKSYVGFNFAGELIHLLAVESEKPGADDAQVIASYKARVENSGSPSASASLLLVSIVSAAVSALLILFAFANHLYRHG